MLSILFYDYYIFKAVSLLWGFGTSTNSIIISMYSEINIEKNEVLI